MIQHPFHPGISRRRTLQAIGAGTCGLLLPGLAQAQASWPTRPVKVLVSFPPGGSSDFVIRTLAPFMNEIFGQPFIVDNRPGAGGMIAAEAIKREAPDGYTFIISNNAPFSIAPTQFKTVNYDPIKDFTHIAYLGSTFGGCVTNPKVGVKTLPELIAKAKANPGKLTFGSSGTGSIGYIVGETFKRLTKIDMLHVPYKGAAPLRQDLLAGVVDASFESLMGSMPLIRAGSLVGLATASAERLPPVPEYPTFREQGIDMVVENWHGLTAPAGLPAAISNRLSQGLATLLQRKDVLDKLAVYGVFLRPMTPAAFNAYVSSELDYWRPQIIAAGVAGQ